MAITATHLVGSHSAAGIVVVTCLLCPGSPIAVHAVTMVMACCVNNQALCISVVGGANVQDVNVQRIHVLFLVVGRGALLICHLPPWL